MYQGFYGLRELPFELTPNTRFLFLTPLYREALSTLQFGLSAGKPLTLLIGEAGTGKTTLIRAALESERCRSVRCVCLNNPVLTPEDFVRTLAVRFKLTREAAASKAVLLDELEEALLQLRSRGERTALVIDEAQSLTAGLLEEVRLLANMETATEKLLPVLLAGQPELGGRLENKGLRQFKQRVTLRCELKPLTLVETGEYMASRIAAAGGVPAKLFTREAVNLVHEYSRGIARTINVICDNALLTGMGLCRQPVDRQIVLEVCRDLALRKRPAETEFESEARADTADVEASVDAASDLRHASERVQAVQERGAVKRRFALRSLFRRNQDSAVPHVVIE